LFFSAPLAPGFLRSCSNRLSRYVGRRINKTAWKTGGVPYGWLIFKKPFHLISAENRNTHYSQGGSNYFTLWHVLKELHKPNILTYQQENVKMTTDVNQMWHTLQVQFLQIYSWGWGELHISLFSRPYDIWERMKCGRITIFICTVTLRTFRSHNSYSKLCYHHRTFIL
jgi:hypothetical protein